MCCVQNHSTLMELRFYTQHIDSWQKPPIYNHSATRCGARTALTGPPSIRCFSSHSASSDAFYISSLCKKQMWKKYPSGRDAAWTHIKESGRHSESTIRESQLAVETHFRCSWFCTCLKKVLTETVPPMTLNIHYQITMTDCSFNMCAINLMAIGQEPQMLRITNTNVLRLLGF